jgi:hypothetical protein
MEDEKIAKKLDKRRYETPQLTKYGKFMELTKGGGSASDSATFGGNINPTEPT